jgi:hypothetical protein
MKEYKIKQKKITAKESFDSIDYLRRRRSQFRSNSVSEQVAWTSPISFVHVVVENRTCRYGGL